MHVPGTHDERRYLRPDITRARVRLAWQPKVELRQGLKLSLGYFSGCAQSENVVSFPHAPAGSSVACN
jgi:dTDP-glucose 4,6-dehydratase